MAATDPYSMIKTLVYINKQRFHSIVLRLNPFTTLVNISICYAKVQSFHTDAWSSEEVFVVSIGATRGTLSQLIITNRQRSSLFV